VFADSWQRATKPDVLRSQVERDGTRVPTTGKYPKKPCFNQSLTNSLCSVINYSGTYQYNGNSYLAVYGWTRSSLIEYCECA